jgi:large subunit ribosomal protein L28
MSRICELTGKARLKGNKVSHSNIKTRCFSMPSLSKRKWHLAEIDRTLSLTLSSSALRTIQSHGGLENAILAVKEGWLSDRLVQIKSQLMKARRKTGSKKAETAPVVKAEPQDVPAN